MVYVERMALHHCEQPDLGTNSHLVAACCHPSDGIDLERWAGSIPAASHSQMQDIGCSGSSRRADIDASADAFFLAWRIDDLAPAQTPLCSWQSQPDKRG